MFVVSRVIEHGQALEEGTSSIGCALAGRLSGMHRRMMASVT